MTRFWRAKLALDFTSKIVPKAPPVRGFISPIRQIGSPISQRFGFPNGACRSNQQLYNPFLGGAKRFYYVDRNQVLGGPRRWFQNRRNVTVLVLLGSGIVITLYFGRYETVPYTKRNHFVLLSRDMDRKIGETLFDLKKKSFERDILPANHPESVRVRLIAKDIIEALQRGLQHDVVSRDLGYGSESVQSRKKGKSHSHASHLEGLDWEVIVVDQPIADISCSHNGKIVVYTGLLKLFKTDAEVATLLGHELARVVARHPAEQVTNFLLVFIPLIIHLLFLVAGIDNTMSNILWRLPFSHPFSRRIELEADYIGLLLMASAGYDPRVALKVYQSFGPFFEKRAQLLSQAHVMQEALDVYKQAKLGRVSEGFP